MQYRVLGNSGLNVSVICLGTWAFGNDSWWGYQNDQESIKVLQAAIEHGINFIDTAPVYGRGHCEEVIGKYIAGNNIRSKIKLATKLGLRWHERNIFHDLSKERMLQEIDDSRKRLNTDYFDLYQIHWPDKNTSISQTAEIIRSWYEKKIIKAVGVSNYSIEQMMEFQKYCPLHCLQPQYSMFCREIEKNTTGYCLQNNIAIISYAPLYSGLLSGKFFLNNAKIPSDINRKIKKSELEEPLFSINRKTLLDLKNIADKYNKTLSQLALNWNFNQPAITCAIAGTRKIDQLIDNIGSTDWVIDCVDMAAIDNALIWRQDQIKKITL